MSNCELSTCKTLKNVFIQSSLAIKSKLLFVKEQITIYPYKFAT